MTVQVEVFDEREIDPSTLMPEPNDEAVALLQELGLATQLTTVVKNEVTTSGRITYPIPTDVQRTVMESLFPAATLLKDYSVGCIPLQVLKEIKSYKENNPNDILVVRHIKANQMKDPILLAYTQHIHSWYATQELPSHEWRNFRMIARWGDGLEDWNVLYKKALKVLAAGTLDALNEIISQCQIAKQMIESGVMPKNSNKPYVNYVDSLFKA